MVNLQHRGRSGAVRKRNGEMRQTLECSKMSISQSDEAFYESDLMKQPAAAFPLLF